MEVYEEEPTNSRFFFCIDAGVDFGGDEMGGYLKIAIANIKIKNGHRIA